MHVSVLDLFHNNSQTIDINVTSFQLLHIKYHLGTSKCHDHDILTLYQPIILQHFERGIMRMLHQGSDLYFGGSITFLTNNNNTEIMDIVLIINTDLRESLIVFWDFAQCFLADAHA